MVFDIRAAEAEAHKEIAQEQSAAAKGKLKAKLKQIAASRQVTSNLEREYQALLAEVAEDVG